MESKLISRAVLALLAIGILAGCENNDDTQSAQDNEIGMHIEPAAIHMSANQTEYHFTVKGGIKPYTWEVSDRSLGTIQSDQLQTSRAIYTRKKGASGQNTIRVTDSHNTNANPNASWTALATVVQD